MLFHEFEAGNNTYKLRLNVRDIVALEKKLGMSLTAVFGTSTDTIALPQLDVLMTIFHAMLQPYNHGITLDKAYEIYQDYLDDGNDLTKFVPVIIEVYKVSGVLPRDMDTEDNDEKN